MGVEFELEFELLEFQSEFEFEFEFEFELKFELKFDSEFEFELEFKLKFQFEMEFELEFEFELEAFSPCQVSPPELQLGCGINFEPPECSCAFIGAAAFGFGAPLVLCGFGAPLVLCGVGSPLVLCGVGAPLVYVVGATLALADVFSSIDMPKTASPRAARIISSLVVSPCCTTIGSAIFFWFFTFHSFLFPYRVFFQSVSVFRLSHFRP
jgi:hypothetical protein